MRAAHQATQGVVRCEHIYAQKSSKKVRLNAPRTLKRRVSRSEPNLILFYYRKRAYEKKRRPRRIQKRGSSSPPPLKGEFGKLGKQCLIFSPPTYGDQVRPRNIVLGLRPKTLRAQIACCAAQPGPPRLLQKTAIVTKMLRQRNSYYYCSYTPARHYYS